MHINKQNTIFPQFIFNFVYNLLIDRKPVGASKSLIAQALGHGRITVTDTYFDYDNELVDDLNRKVLDLLI